MAWTGTWQRGICRALHPAHFHSESWSVSLTQHEQQTAGAREGNERKSRRNYLGRQRGSGSRPVPGFLRLQVDKWQHNTRE